MGKLRLPRRTMGLFLRLLAAQRSSHSSNLRRSARRLNAVLVCGGSEAHLGLQVLADRLGVHPDPRAARSSVATLAGFLAAAPAIRQVRRAKVYAETNTSFAHAKRNIPGYRPPGPC